MNYWRVWLKVVTRRIKGRNQVLEVMVESHNRPSQSQQTAADDISDPDFDDCNGSR
jgi:hypothetical protein